MDELLKKHQVCFIEDEFIANRLEGHSRWVITLNSGHTIWQDDDREGTEPKSAWIRLGNYCRESGDFITNFIIQFRSHKEHLPPNQDGYYFVKSILGSFHTHENFHFMVAGWTLNENPNGCIIRTREYKIPELIEISSEDREVEKDDICLIRKPK